MIALDILYNDFETTTASLFKSNNKILDQIQSILQSKKVKNIGKKTTEVIRDLAIGLRNSNNYKKGAKRKAGSDEKYYNCHKLGYYARDYNIPDKRPYQRNRDQSQNSTRGRQNNNRNRTHQATANNNVNNSDPKPFLPGQVLKIFMVKKQGL